MSGDLPKSWGVATLGEIGSWVGGGTPSKQRAEYWVGGTIPWVSPKDMESHRIVGTVDHITQVALDSSPALLIPANSVLVVVRSGILSHTLPVAVTAGPVAVNQDLKAMIPARSVSSEYVTAALRRFGGKILHECAKTGTTVSSVEFRRLKDFSIPIPPLAEQHRIVAKIEELFTKLDAGVEALQKVKKQLKQYRQAVLRDAFTGELTREWRERELGDPGSAGHATSLGVQELPELPLGWAWSPLGSIAEVQLGKMLSRMAFGDGLQQLPYLRNQNVRWGSIDYSDLKTMGFKPAEIARYSVQEGDLLVCEGGEPGRCAVTGREVNGLMYQKALHRVRPIRKGMDARYLQLALTYVVLHSPAAPRYSETTIKHLPRERMLTLPVPLTSEAEQREIVAEIERHFSIADAVERTVDQSLKQAEQLRQSILKRAFEGKLVPQDPNDEPAEKLLARIMAEKAKSGDRKPKSGPKAARGRPRKDPKPDAKGAVKPEQMELF